MLAGALTHQPANLVQKFGCPVSHVVADPQCSRFVVPGIEGLIPFRRGFRVCVGIGDPICDPRDCDAFAEQFRISCARRGLGTIFAATSESFAAHCIERGYAAIEFGQELILDPRRDPQSGHRGRELRKKVNRADRAGVIVEEYRPNVSGDETERRMERAARAWLEQRRGPQVFISPLRIFGERMGRRWFFARLGSELVGVLSLLRIDVRDGWVFEHLIYTPDSPQGVTEMMVVSALRVLGQEKCSYATFGPDPLPRLGLMVNVSRYGEAIGRAVFDGAVRLWGLDSGARYHGKFQPTDVEPSYLLFHPPRVGLGESMSLLRAFNVSFKR